MKMHYEAGPNIFKKAAELRDNETDAEKYLWQYISKNQLGFKFRRQHPLKFFIADFYCHEAKLIIELDGGIHLEKSQKEYDENREFEISRLGITTMRFTNEEVFHNIDEVLEKIKEHLKNKR